MDNTGKEIIAELETLVKEKKLTREAAKEKIIEVYRQLQVQLKARNKQIKENEMDKPDLADMIIHLKIRISQGKLLTVKEQESMLKIIGRHLEDDMDLLDENMKLVKQIEGLKKKVILSEAQNYCKICGSTLDGYVPSGSDGRPYIGH